MQEKKFLITLKADYFQQKTLNKAPAGEPTPGSATELATEPTKHKKSKLEL